MTSRRRIISQVIAVAMVLSVVPLARPAAAATTSEVRARVTSLRTSLTQVGARLAAAERALDEATVAIAQHRAALEAAKVRGEALRRAMAYHAAQLYMLGGPITHPQRALIGDITELRAHSDQQRALLDAASNHALASRNELAARQRDLSVQLGELARLEQYLASLAPRTGARAARSGARGVYCPVEGPSILVDNFGDPRPGGPHKGVDIRADVGQGVRAVLPATVVDTPSGDWIGIGIVIRDAAGNEWWYAHLSDSSVVVGQRVSSGQVIGRVGCTGRCYGSHLHFEFHPDGGDAVDPYGIVAGSC